MNRYFYGSKKDLINKLKELKIQFKIKNNEILIENGIIKYEEKNLPIRTFSITRFPKKGLELEINNIDNKIIDKICMPYNKDEINAIIRDMPVIKWYSKNHKNTLSDVAIIWRDHFLEENVGLLNGFVEMGVNPRNILAIDKGDSTKHRFEITETFKKMGFNVSVLDNTNVDNEELMKIGEKLIHNFIKERI